MEILTKMLLRPAKALPEIAQEIYVNSSGRGQNLSIFNALAEGGKIQMPLEKTFWAERFGMAVDKFGTPWIINCD